MGALELVLAVIGAGSLSIMVIVVGGTVFYLVRDRLYYGKWWWDETADGLESRNG